MSPRNKALGSAATGATDENPFLQAHNIDRLSERVAALTGATTRVELATNRLEAALNRHAELLGKLLDHLAPPQPQQPSGDAVAPKET